MAEEYFFALTLKGTNDCVLWDPESHEADGNQGDHKMIIKQALVGPEATEGKINVVEVETLTWKDTVQIPIALLKAGGATNQVRLNLSLTTIVWFTLVQGNGPVHIMGQYVIGSPMEDKEGDEKITKANENEKAKAMNNLKNKTVKNKSKTKN